MLLDVRNLWGKAQVPVPVCEAVGEAVNPRLGVS